MRHAEDGTSQIDHARRDFFLDRGTEVFAKRGFEAPTMADLADACSCERRTLYRYFSSKQEFFWGAAGRAYNQLVDRFLLVFQVWESARLTAAARVLSWGVTYFEYSLEQPRAFRLIMMAREQSVASAADPAASPEPAASSDRSEALKASIQNLAALDRAMLGGLASLGPQLEAEGLCEGGTGTTRLWELLGVLIGLVEFHARYRGGGVNYPFGTPEGIRAMIERQVEQAFPPKEGPT
jgi:AcrR family transcriptional regulator